LVDRQEDASDPTLVYSFETLKMNTSGRIKMICILTILIFSVAGTILGQDTSKVDDVPGKKAEKIDDLIQRNIEHAIKEKETEWTLCKPLSLR